MIHSLQTFALAVVVILFGAFVVRAVYRLIAFRATSEYRKTILDAAYLLDDKHTLNDTEALVLSRSVLDVYDYRFKTALMSYALNKDPKEKPALSEKMRPEIEAATKAFAVIAMFENPYLTFRLINRQIKTAADTKISKNTTTVARAESVVARTLPFVDSKRHQLDLVAC